MCLQDAPCVLTGNHCDVLGAAFSAVISKLDGKPPKVLPCLALLMLSQVLKKGILAIEDSDLTCPLMGMPF